ncbi:MAG: OmpA family protein [Bacteroides sp.]|nr:OmpA family protein [Bacteroides sp.]
MKSLLKIFNLTLVLSFIFVCYPAVGKTIKLSSNSPEVSKSVNQVAPESGEDLDEIEFVEMLNSVPLDAKSAELIRKFQEKEGRNRLHARDYNEKNGCTVETFRNKEVLLITIPAEKLFGPNSTELRPTASSLLNPIKRYLKDPDMYRVLMVMHTDNTGSEKYRDTLTEKRSHSIAEWFENQGTDTEYLFPYAYGDDMPLVKNNSMSNRAKNRRLEIYLVPGKKMLEQAKKGRIVF